jgi:hypothetical protein
VKTATSHQVYYLTLIAILESISPFMTLRLTSVSIFSIQRLIRLSVSCSAFAIDRIQSGKLEHLLLIYFSMMSLAWPIFVSSSSFSVAGRVSSTTDRKLANNLGAARFDAAVEFTEMSRLAVYADKELSSDSSSVGYRVIVGIP